MTDWFITVLNMTIAGGAAAVVVLVLRLVLRKMPRIYSYVLWLAVFWRFACPFALETAFSLFPVNRESVAKDIVYDLEPAVDTGIGLIDQAVNPVLSGSLAPVPTASANPLQILLAALGAVWAAGAILCVGVQLWRYLRFAAKVRTGVAVPGEDRVLWSEWTDVPVVMGLVRPVIVLPYGIGEKELSYILLHERAHIARGDHLVKAVCFLITAVHWFQPLAWVSFREMCRDMEMCCDERVVRDMDLEGRKGYAGALLSFAKRKSGILQVPAFGESHTKARMKRVLSFRRPAAAVNVAALLCTALAGCGLLTSPQGTESAPAVTVIGGADGPTSIFVAGKLAGGEEPVPYEAAVWDGTTPADGIVLDAAGSGGPAEEGLLVFHGPQGVFVLQGDGDSGFRQLISVDMAGVDERYGELYGELYGDGSGASAGDRDAEIQFVVENSGNSVAMGFLENGQRLEGHGYLLLLDSQELYRTDDGFQMLETLEELEAEHQVQMGMEDGQSRLVSDTGRFQDLELEVTGENGTRERFPLF